jgi:hypothetical protein
VIKQVYRVKKEGRLNKNSDLTLDIEKPTIEKSSASSIDQIVPNNEHVANNLAEQQSCSAGGQHDHKVVGSQGTGLTGVLTGLAGLARKFGRAQSVTPNNQAVRKRPSFVELLHKYQRIAEQKRNNRLGEQRRISSSPKAMKHRRSSHRSSSFIPSMHVPWTVDSALIIIVHTFGIILGFLQLSICLWYTKELQLATMAKIRASTVRFAVRKDEIVVLYIL